MGPDCPVRTNPSETTRASTGSSACVGAAALRSLRGMTPFRRPPRDRPPRRQDSLVRNPRDLPKPGAEIRFDLNPDEEAALLGALAPLVPPDVLPEAAKSFRDYLAGLVGWNIRSNLVAAGDRDRLVRRHVVESLACVPLLDELGGSTLIDLGSGGGFPGVPIKLVRPQLEVALVESRRMKSLFLKRTIASLRLGGIVAWQVRAETLGGLPAGAAADASLATGPGALSSPGAFASPDDPRVRPVVDLVTSRAVAAMEKTTRWVAPLVRPGGCLVTFKGSRVDEELVAWKANPGPWELIRLEREVLPGLTLVALRRLDFEEPDLPS